ncbi:MAG: sodium:solute symporter [Spirochaetia bacterium]|nr:sodium:solute symporter [Spirochaetia bacterium]MDD7269373.1 sodium:solute symporter [Treponema sp.]
MIAITILLLVVFFAVMIGVGIYSRRHATDVNGFVLGGRGVGPWLTAFAFGTSYFSAVIFVGYAGQFGWLFGLASTWAGLGNAFIGSLLAWNILGRRTRIMTQHIDAKTMPDYFGKRFDSTPLKIVASLIVFVFLIPYTASLYNGLSSLFGLVFNIPYWVVILIMAVLTGFYVIFGGYMATAINDFIQGIIMLVGIVAVIGAVVTQNGGLLAATQKLSAVPAAGWTGGAYTSFFGPDPVFLLFVVILTSLGTWGLPQMVGKFYAIKSENDIHKGTVISTVFAIIVAGGCYFLGGFGRLYADKISYSASGKPLFDTIVPAMLSTLAPVIIAVVIVLVLSASMSTLSSLVLTSSSTFTLDVIKPASKKEMTEKKQVLIMRIFIVFFIIVSAVIAIIKDANPGVTFIAQMMGVSWGGLAGAFLAPYLYGLYSKKVTKASVVVCFIWGTGLAITQFAISMAGVDVAAWPSFFALMFKTSIHSGAFAMIGGLIIVPLVSLFTKKPSNEFVDKIFACYDQKVQTSVKESLGE